MATVAKILMHRNYAPVLIDPVTGQSVEAARACQRDERIRALATLKASFDEVRLADCHPELRRAYLQNAEAYYDMTIGGLSL